MIWFLGGVSIVFAFLGDYTEALILSAALIPLVGMDAYLHQRTRASTQGLASKLAAEARVMRDGSVLTIPARGLVPGDLVTVHAGEPFPADGLIVSGEELQAEESTLTGEAYPSRKRTIALASGATSNSQPENWVFAGTRLLTGEASIRVAYTGGETLYGEIVRSALVSSHARTPLQKAVGRLVWVMLGGAAIVCVLLAVIRYVQGHGIVDALLSAVTLAIAALPEEFPVVFTFFLGVGVYRLAQRQALVRRAVAVENIGRVTCICSDKTGTLTEGKLRLAHTKTAEGVSPERLIQSAALAALSDSGDPLDAALNAAANPDVTVQQLALFPFTEQRRRETSIVRMPDGSRVAIVKGAPETVLGMCSNGDAAKEEWSARVGEYAATGHKVIACATRTLDNAPAVDVEPDRGYVMTGILAFEDPVREGVREAITSCRAAGIRVIMVTGDHPSTAEAIALEIGLGDRRPCVISADQLATGSDQTRANTLATVDVIARAAPAQKLALVRALQAAGEIVAVTGDGVNDVPALQAADIGIAMGERGTRSAREVAAIVLLNDNFRTIVGAIAEGRQLFRNLQLSFAYILMVHIPLVLSAAIIPLVGYPLLYLPIHIVWLELIIHPTALLVFQDGSQAQNLLRVERDGPSHFFTRNAWLAITAVGLLVTAIIVVAYGVSLGDAGNANHARSMALALLIIFGATVTAVLSEFKTATSRGAVAGSIASLLLFVQISTVARLMHLEPLHLGDWLLAASGGVSAGLAALVVRQAVRGDAHKLETQRAVL
jgi:Ca2+-transporting ATPase